MRILFLHRYPLKKITGGVAEFLYYLPLYLKKYSIESFMYSEGSKKLVTGETYANGLKSFTGPFVKQRLINFNSQFAALQQLCQQEQINLIHSQETYRSGYIAYKLSGLTKIPYIITSHADIAPTNSQRIQRENVKIRCRKILSAAAGVTHLTPFMADISHQMLDTRSKSAIIGNGIDANAWQAIPKFSEKNYILAIGRMVPEKGFDILIAAFARLTKMGINQSLVIAGSGKESDNLKKQAKQLGLLVVEGIPEKLNFPARSVIFTGYVTGDIKKQIIKQSQIVLFATQPKLFEEAFGIVFLEAMAAGKPIISSNIQAARYLQNLGLQIILLPADNIDAWAKEIKYLLQDPIHAEKMGTENLSLVNDFDWEHIAKLYADFYRTTLELAGAK
jgi:glycosyltransferase involved in cell wall biosynthesis